MTRFSVSKQIVFVFDIASSTLLIEDLQQTGRTVEYAKLISPISSFLDENAAFYKYSVHKFLGDGFILVFDQSQTIDNVLIYSVALTTKCSAHIHTFKRAFIQTKEVERLGITIGIDKGEVYPLNLRGSDELYGRPINVACRLQSSLTKPEHVNKVLMSQLCYAEVDNKVLRDTCAETSRTLKNINNSKEVTCYEFNPNYFKGRDLGDLRKPVKTKVEKSSLQIPGYVEQVKQIYEIAASSTTLFVTDTTIPPRK